MINTLWENYRKIKEGTYKTLEYIYIVESSKEIENPITINDFFELWAIKAIKTDFLKEKSLKNFRDKISYLQNISKPQEVYYYIIIAKIISIFDEKLNKPAAGVNPFFIVNDFLNILSLYFSKYFRTKHYDHIFLIENNIDFKPLILFENYIKLKPIEESNEIFHNLEIICSLRYEQFIFLQKGLNIFNSSLQTADYNISTAFSLLISVIESFASKYSKAKEKWEDYENETFYKGLKNILENSENNDLLKNLFYKIGDLFVKSTYRVMAKFRDFILTFAPSKFRILEDSHDKLFIEDLNSYYILRSKYLHTGKEFPLKTKEGDLIYNLTKDGEKIKKYGENKRLDIKLLFSYNWFTDLVKSCVSKFIDCLYYVRDDYEDKKLYTENDKIPRGQIRVQITKVMKPGEFLRNGDFYRRKQYIDFFKRDEKLKILEKKEEYRILIKEYEQMLHFLKESNDKLKLIHLYSKLGEFYSYISEINKAIEYIDKSHEINLEIGNKNLLAQDYYNYACFYCLKGEKDKSIEFLKKALSIPENFSDYLREQAKTDPQLEKCRNEPKFIDLISKK